jgi:hypothetical protein
MVIDHDEVQRRGALFMENLKGLAPAEPGTDVHRPKETDMNEPTTIPKSTATTHFELVKQDLRGALRGATDAKAAAGRSEAGRYWAIILTQVELVYAAVDSWQRLVADLESTEG